MSKPSSASAHPFAFPGTCAKAIAEKTELLASLISILKADPHILPKGKTFEDVLTADPVSVSLFSSFWRKRNLSNDKRAYINGISTDLFSKQKNARKNSLSPCFVWPGDGNRYEENIYIINHYGEKIIAPNIWLFLSLSNCHGSFDSVDLVETFFRPWLFAIQKSIFEHHFNKIRTAQEKMRTNASILLKMLSELKKYIKDATILESQKENKIEEVGTLITNLFTQFENVFVHIHGKLIVDGVSIDNLFNTNIYKQMFDNHKTIFDEQSKMFITIRDIINTQLKYPHSDIKFAFLASRPPSRNLLPRLNACVFDEHDEPSKHDESSIMSID
jgi:hypothetical protein